MTRCNFLLFLLVSAALVQCQTPAPTEEPTATFKSNVPAVLVDVVVTNNHGERVGALKSTDFEVFEDGKRQSIASFEEHKSAAPTRIQLPPMPPGVFSNFPTISKAESVNVLLVDGLNTSLADKSFVHSQILKYLKTIPAGIPVAVFTLTGHLRMLQEFTSDPSALLAAVNAASQGLPQRSAVLQEKSETRDLDSFRDFIESESSVGPTTPQDWIHESVSPSGSLQEALQEEAGNLAEVRTRTTLESMQELARYLDAFPGRKNVIWVSGSFPLVFFPRGDVPDPYQFVIVRSLQGQIQRTADLLTAARVAIYPVGSQGLLTDTLYEANGEKIGTLARERSQNQGTSLRNEIDDRMTARQSMDELAMDTGGQAFYDTNGIGDVLARVTESSADFYTISYLSSNTKMDGKFRHITVKLTNGKEKLSYRRGYYADSKEKAVESQTSDPLLPLLGFGVPDISQIVYKVRIAPAKIQGAQGSGENAAKAKLTTYDVDFAVSLADLEFDLMNDGTRRGTFEFKLVAYDDSGRSLSTVGGNYAVTLKPDQYAAMQRVGLQIHRQIDVPGQIEAHLHTGICDLKTGKIGTLGMKLLAADPAKPAER